MDLAIGGTATKAAAGIMAIVRRRIARSVTAVVARGGIARRKRQKLSEYWDSADQVTIPYLRGGQYKLVLRPPIESTQDLSTPTRRDTNLRDSEIEFER
jgi:hypothetical protein